MNPFAADAIARAHIEDLHREAAERRLARQLPTTTGPIRAAWHATVTAVTAKVRAAAQPTSASPAPPMSVSPAQPACCPA